VNNSGVDVCAISYGRQDRLIAGEVGFEQLYLEHQQELKAIGKRPDLLLFRNNDRPKESLNGKNAHDLIGVANKAVAAFEVRSSQQTCKRLLRGQRQQDGRNSVNLSLPCRLRIALQHHQLSG